jgi:hypothetical protein
MKLAASLLTFSALFSACAGPDAASSTSRTSWASAETNGVGTPAQWKGLDGAETLSVVSDGTGHVYNLLLSTQSYGPDVHVSTRLRADSGTEDQGGGVVWRAKDAANYYVSRWNPLENNLRIYKVVDSKRTQLASISGELAAGWLDFEVTMRGSEIVVRCGTLSLGVEDSTYIGAGFVGLWTKADACTSFARPQVETLR